MTVHGWIFMIAVWSMILTMFSLSLRRALRSDKDRAGRPAASGQP